MTQILRLWNGENFIGDVYPEDIKYNVCQIGKNIIHNFKFTDSKVDEIIENKNLTKIQVAQGYSNCAIAVIDQNAVIVTDSKIAEILRKHNVDVLCLDYIPEIKLLNENDEYSKMNGFIGGAIARIENKIIVFGDLKKIDKNEMIYDFIRKYNLEIVDFKNLDVIDYGGMVVI